MQLLYNHFHSEDFQALHIQPYSSTYKLMEYHFVGMTNLIVKFMYKFVLNKLYSNYLTKVSYHHKTYIYLF